MKFIATNRVDGLVLKIKDNNESKIMEFDVIPVSDSLFQSSNYLAGRYTVPDFGGLNTYEIEIYFGDINDLSTDVDIDVYDREGNLLESRDNRYLLLRIPNCRK